MENKSSGGRPAKDPTVVLNELQKRYPNGAPVKTLAELRCDNPDLAGRLKTLGNSAQKLFGKSLMEHLNDADVLASGRYKVYDGRSGANWIEDYVFPYTEEWYSDRYIIEDDGIYIECCPRPL